MLFEMLTMRVPFCGDTMPALLYAVVNSDLPPLDGLPTSMQRIIRKCLAKSPAGRYASIDDAIRDLENIQRTAILPDSKTITQPVPAAIFETQPSRRPITIWLAAGVLVLLVGAGAWWVDRKPPQPVRTASVPVTPPAVQSAPQAVPTPAPAPPLKAEIAVRRLPPKPASELRPPEPTRYAGPRDGRMIWTGELEPGQVLDMTAAGSRASVSGALPGEAISVEIHPDSVHVVTPPGPANKWRTLVVRNEGKVRQVSIVVSWHITVQ